MLAAPLAEAAPSSLALEPFAKPHASALLEFLAGNGPVGQRELASAVGAGSEATLSRHATPLLNLGAVDRKPGHEGAARTVTYRMREPGIELLSVSRALEEWCRGTERALVAPPDPWRRSQVVNAIRRAWAMELIGGLAEGDRSVSELLSEAEAGSSQTLYREISRLEKAGIVKARKRGGTQYYSLTELGKAAIRPIIWAYRWERNHIPDRLGRLAAHFVRTAFKLTLELSPLHRFPNANFTLICQEPGSETTGVTAFVDDTGQIHYSPQSRNVDIVIIGTPMAWMDAVTVRQVHDFRIGGDKAQARLLLAAMSIAIAGNPKDDN